MATTCTFNSYAVAANGVTTASTGTIDLDDVLVDQPTTANNPENELRITGNTLANPTVVTTHKAHGCATGDHVFVKGSNSTPVINGDQEVTVISGTTFSVAVNVTVAGTVGTCTRTKATVTANLQPAIYVAAAAAATAGVARGWYHKIASATFMKMAS